MYRSENHPAGKATTTATKSAVCWCEIGMLVPGQKYCVTCLELFADDSPVRGWWDDTCVPGRPRPLAARNPELAREMLLYRAQSDAAAYRCQTEPLMEFAAYCFNRLEPMLTNVQRDHAERERSTS